MPATLQIQLLGGMRVALDNKPIGSFYSIKAPALLAYLAVARRATTRDTLASLLWGEMSDVAAKTNLRQALANLHKLLEPYLLITRDSAEFNFDAPYTLDVEQFEAILRGSNFSDAVALYKGDFLDGVFVRDAPDFEEWALAQRARLRELALQAMSALLTRCAARGENARGIEYATRLIALDPWREEAHRELMLMLARTGQRSVALAQYETCKRVLQKQMGVEPSAETTALFERIRAAGASPRHNLPAQSTTFIGRARELAQIESALLNPERRLVTLLGVGGIGKTRLALQAAERALRIGTFLNGVYFVPLAGVDLPDLIAPAIASVCEFVFSGKQDPKAQVINFLREKEMLLILDNFEHLLDAAAWLSQLLASAPHVKLLVTSRERLNLRWEWLVAIEGLEYPTSERMDGAQPGAAMNLFVERARQTCPDFELNDATRASVARVCQLVEGMPLGIELAAAWAQAHACDEIARELERGYDFLATTQRDAPERQRSLRAVFDRSWQLLDPAARQVFSRLSVFRGGFTREAASRVTGASLASLSALVDKSLVRHNAGGRYELHEVLLRYAEEKLGESTDAETQTRDLRSEYYAAFLAQRETPIQGASQKDALGEISAEKDNVSAAWQWMIATRRSAWIEQSLVSLGYFYEIKSWFQEGATVFQQAAGAFADATAVPLRILNGKLLLRQMIFLIRLDRYAEAREVGYTCLNVLRGTDEQTGLARAVSNLGHITYRLGNLTEARQLFQESLDLNRAGGDSRQVAIALNNLGVITLALGEYAQARQFFEESLALKRPTGDQRSIANSLDNLGIIAREQGDFAQARQFHHDSLAIYEALNDQRGAQTALNNLGATAFREGHYDEAKQFLQKSLSISGADQHHGIITGFTLARLGAVASALGEYDKAHRSLCDALKTAVDISSVPLALLVVAELGALLHAEGKGAASLELLTLVAFHPSSEQEARDRARSLLTQFTPQFSSDVLAAADARGRARKLEEVIAQVLQAE